MHHTSIQASHSFLHQPSGAKRIQRDQARGLRAFVLGTFAQFFGHSRREEGVFA